MQIAKKQFATVPNGKMFARKIKTKPNLIETIQTKKQYATKAAALVVF